MAPPTRRVRPTATDAYLGNPHKGCCTFQRFNGDPLFEGTGWSEKGPTSFSPPAGEVAEGYLPTTVAYCRWFWNVLEPAPGEYDFAMIDGALAACEQRGQTLAVRLMPFGTRDDEALPEWYAADFPTEISHKKRRPLVAPVHDAPEYLQHYGNLIREFARRYDGHEFLETIDVAYIGPWGEGAGECDVAQCRRFAKLWQEAFVRTPRLALIAGDQMREAIATGSGWRCDCFGDLRGFGGAYVSRHLRWNHMFDCYPQAVAAAGATDAWKTAPVHFETCWVPMAWYREGRDIDFICRQGLKYHGTYFMPKSTRLPEAWMEKLAGFCRSLGYRFVLRQAEIDAQVPAGGSFRLRCWIENVGAAPLYHRYDFALRLRQGDRDAVVPLAHLDVRTWLPGDVILDEQVALPEAFRPGWAELSAGLVRPGTRDAKVRFAVKEQYPDGWADLGGIEIV